MHILHVENTTSVRVLQCTTASEKRYLCYYLIKGKMEPESKLQG